MVQKYILAQAQLLVYEFVFQAQPLWNAETVHAFVTQVLLSEVLKHLCLLDMNLINITCHYIFYLAYPMQFELSLE